MDKSLMSCFLTRVVHVEMCIKVCLFRELVKAVLQKTFADVYK